MKTCKDDSPYDSPLLEYISKYGKLCKINYMFEEDELVPVSAEFLDILLQLSIAKAKEDGTI